MRRHLRFSAVLIVVVLALTGFSTGSSSGKSGSKSKSRSSSSSGGGCSSSKKDNDTSRGSGYRGGYRDTHQDDTSSSTGGSSSSTTTDQVTVTVVDCAGPGRTKRAKADSTAALRVTSNATADDLSVRLALHFENAAGSTLDSPTTELRLAPGESRTVTVRMTNPRKAAQVRDCEVDRVTAVKV
ncbi:hypothetical protein ACFU9O_30200 [Streptomyces albidoflavus]|jgi:hypothetical protein|uniref:Uncharacterized protein n=1 Tax=Streptomyces albidoflavus TaxID=1886 RepID=A0A8G1ZSD9_9ACTN|nr:MULTISPECIES: hypothetical protein [Streptomyces]MYW58487.1 hypothetical protein [Streptomyces sp. SID8370]MYW88006.1 hypothetical protein [Streptomyces sp. SID8371]MYX50497.1 hypothetical protein [Streptomyces sp. SID8385]MYX83231.1 hypothetical protein [Streptomyces sp. SID4915]NUW10344.1 hypothetical protein [Streptomyces sp. CAI-21]QLA57179.1 hypothetical protein HWN34_11775 [Streptomyces violascens]SCD37254.1 hypothetical protein GA0115236_103723 [Streptomyces sp. IgraMP-1]